MIRNAALLAALVTALVTLIWPAPAAAQPSVLTPPPMMFVVDVSSSMGDADSNGTVKLEAAQQSLLTAINAAATPHQPVGLWSYPSGDDCGAGRLERPAVSGGADELDAIIRALRPNGNTPTAAALQSAVDTLEAAGNETGTVILVSDGESNCDGDPCETAKSITQQGFQLQVQTVGFAISEAGRQELECVADATGGRYFDVTEGDALGDTLGKLTSAQLDLSVDAPASTAAGLTVGVTATVSNPSVNDAGDVTVAIQATTAKDGKDSGFVAVAGPVRKLGNLAPDKRATQSWSIAIPPGSTVDTLRLRISATTMGAVPSIVDKTVPVRDGVTARDLGPLLTGATKGTVAILGDSYSSGEGAGGYLPGTDAPANRCHRSEYTYGKDLFANRKVIACSGAVVENLYSPQWNGDKNQAIAAPPQLEALREIAGETRVVLLSMGGNDINFKGIVQDCAGAGDCHPFTPELADRMTWLARRLPTAYQAVDSVVNSPDAIAARGGKVTPIIVLAYPSLVTIQDVGHCPYLSRDDADNGDALVHQLDTLLDNAVRTAQRRGTPVYFASDLEDAFRPDHTLCAAAEDRYVVPIHLPDLLNPVRVQQMMHPNALGYQALTGALIRWSNRDQPTVDRHTVTQPVRTETSADPTGTQETHTRGDAIHVTADGFAPGSTVQLELHSTPRALATGIANADGTVDFVSAVPTDTPTGRHHLVMSGVDKTGEPRTVTAALDVEAAIPWWVHGFLGTSVLGCVVIGVGLRRLRAGRRRQPGRR